MKHYLSPTVLSDWCPNTEPSKEFQELHERIKKLESSLPNFILKAKKFEELTERMDNIGAELKILAGSLPNFILKAKKFEELTERMDNIGAELKILAGSPPVVIPVEFIQQKSRWAEDMLDLVKFIIGTEGSEMNYYINLMPEKQKLDLGNLELSLSSLENRLKDHLITGK